MPWGCSLCAPQGLSSAGDSHAGCKGRHVAKNGSTDCNPLMLSSKCPSARRMLLQGWFTQERDVTFPGVPVLEDRRTDISVLTQA